MRKAIDGLSYLVEPLLAQKPASGNLFVFVARDRSKVKIHYCCPLIPLAVSTDDASWKIAVKLVQQEIEASSPRWAMSRFGNAQAERCSSILRARWFCPLMSLTRLFPKPPTTRSNPK
jgi:hypothetical protein